MPGCGIPPLRGITHCHNGSLANQSHGLEIQLLSEVGMFVLRKLDKRV